MALETIRIAVDDTAYVLIGENVTALTIEERIVGGVRLVIKTTGGAAPLLNETNYFNFDGEFPYYGSAADIYVLSPLGAATVGIIRE